MHYGEPFILHNRHDLEQAVDELGIVPFFTNSIPGFSIEEHAAPDVWFSGGDGPWEWKGPVICAKGCAYGKWIEKKAAFIRQDLFFDFANVRRNGLTLSEQYEEGLVPLKDKELYDLLCERAPVLSRRLKRAGHFGKGQKTGFDTILTRLQTGCHILISDFVYDKDALGRTYGWGVAEYSTPERFFGESFSASWDACAPEQSLGRLLTHMKRIVPQAEEKQMLKVIRGK